MSLTYANILEKLEYIVRFLNEKQQPYGRVGTLDVVKTKMKKLGKLHQRPSEKEKTVAQLKRKSRFSGGDQTKGEFAAGRYLRSTK